MRRLDDGGMTGARSVDGLSMCDCTGTVSDHVSVPYLICVGRYLCVGLYRNTTLNGENLPDRTYYDYTTRTDGRRTGMCRAGAFGAGVSGLWPLNEFEKPLQTTTIQETTRSISSNMFADPWCLVTWSLW